MAASDAAKEAVYLKRLLKEIMNFEAKAVTLNIDNQGALVSWSGLPQEE